MTPGIRVSAFLALALTALACTGSETPEGRAAPTPTAEQPCDINALVERVRRGWYPARAPDVLVIPKEPNYVGAASSPTHNGPWPYLTHVPLVFYGPGVIEGRGRVSEPATMADVAPTLADLIGFDGFPDRDGKALKTVTDAVQRQPRLVVSLVWDGGGWNALEAHPRAWPYLRSLMSEGTSFERFDIGSSPSVTPPVHATLGTGSWPRHHGIVSVKQRGEGGELIDPWENNDPANLKVATLADLYDRARDNEPLAGVVATVNWHLGMVGHGSALRGGDRDIAVLLDDVGSVYGNASYYDLADVGDPSLLDAITDEFDAGDGQRDGHWLGNDLSDTGVRYATPAYSLFQEEILERVISEGGFGVDEVPDLLYVNFKQPDDAYHQWGMYSDEEDEVLATQDRALEALVRHLDDEVGRGRWVIALTADHGLMPAPEESGGLAISGAVLKEQVEDRFGADEGELVTRVASSGLYLDRDVMRAAGASGEEIADWLAGYTVADNFVGTEVPERWRDRTSEIVWDAVLPAPPKTPARACPGS